MGPVLLFFILLALPVVLMVVAHYFGVVSQDTTAGCIVILDDRASSQSIAEKHAKRYKLTVTKLFDGAVKGYLATVPLRQMASLERDPRVVRVDRQEPPEFDAVPARKRPPGRQRGPANRTRQVR